MAHILAAFLVAALQLQPVAPGQIQGTVLGQSGAAAGPLSFALVEVVGATGARSAIAGGDGRYLLTDVPSGVPLVLRAVHVGYEDTAVELTVPAGRTLTVDLRLERKPIVLPGVTVDGRGVVIPPLPGRSSTPGARRTRAELALRSLEASPGLAESGLGEAAARPPGSDPSDPSDVLFMRGSTADTKLVLLDGAPVYTPFHLGGLLRSFDEEVLGSATHHVGGAPARFDGGLSYILELRTRSPARDRLRVSGAADLMSAAVSAETPLGERAAALFSTRALHGLQSRLAGGDASPYGYLDGLARGVVDLAPGHALSLTAFGNEESVRLRIPGGASEALAAADAPSLPPESASWANNALALGYAGRWERTTLDVSAAASRYRADLPVPVPAPSAGSGAGSGSEGASGPRDVLVASGATRRVRVAADAVRFGESGSVRVGAAVDRSQMTLGARRYVASQPGPEEEYQREAVGTVAGAYLDVTRRIAPALQVRTGLRFDRFEPGGAHAALRLALMWSLTDQALLTVAGGRYHQLIRTTDAEMELALGDNATNGTGGFTGQVERYPLLSLATADHVLLSLDQQLAPGLRLTTEGFFKRFAGLDGVGHEALNASGLDLRVLREGERVTAWLGYSLSWFWERPDPFGRAQAFTGRQLLSAGLEGRIAGPWGADFALAYSDGLPLTSIPFARSGAEAVTDHGTAVPTSASGSGELSTTATTDTFLRIDVELFAELEPSWRGRDFRIRPYLRVINALDRRDALFYYFDSWRDPGLRPLAELSLIPVLGAEWRF